VTDFTRTRSHFQLPPGVVYLDGNSLGPPTVDTAAALARRVTDEWSAHLVQSWNRYGWFAQPRQLGDLIAPLIGAPSGGVVLGDSLSLTVFQALAAALDLNSRRRVILSDTGNFPSDLYIVQGLVRMLDRGHTLKLVAPEAVAAAIDEEVAVVLLTEVDYRTARRHDMKAVTRRAHDAGALTVWDLAHSTGAIPVNVLDADADFAAGCTYKYLNAGPGAPSYVYVNEKHLERIRPALSGWLGHEAPFSFDLDFRPGRGIERMRVATPQVLAMPALEAALCVWEGVTIGDVRAASIALSELFIREVERRCPELALASPRNPAERGSHVSFHHPDGYPVMQALIARGLIGDFRTPDMIRFAITPLYIGEPEIRRAVDILEDVLTKRVWTEPVYQRKAFVT
jgi:kynureninase